MYRCKNLIDLVSFVIIVQLLIVMLLTVITDRYYQGWKKTDDS